MVETKDGVMAALMAGKRAELKAASMAGMMAVRLGVLTAASTATMTDSPKGKRRVVQKVPPWADAMVENLALSSASYMTIYYWTKNKTKKTKTTMMKKKKTQNTN
jgi:hypothetical protein